MFGKSAFMAKKNVISSGHQVLVLAVIISIGSTLFSQFTAGFGGAASTIDRAMAVVLAALSLLGLGIFGPGIANGLVSGGPQLGAVRPSGPASLRRHGRSRRGRRGRRRFRWRGARGGAAAAARGGELLWQEEHPLPTASARPVRQTAGVASGLRGVASAGRISCKISPLRRRGVDGRRQPQIQLSGRKPRCLPRPRRRLGVKTAAAETAASADAAPPNTDSPPAWAQRMKRSQQMTTAFRPPYMPMRSGDDQSWRGSSSMDPANDHVQATIDALRQDSATRDALPARSPSLDRRIGSAACRRGTGASGIRLSPALGGLSAALVWQSRERLDRPLGGAGRQARQPRRPLSLRPPIISPTIHRSPSTSRASSRK